MDYKLSMLPLKMTDEERFYLITKIAMIESVIFYMKKMKMSKELIRKEEGKLKELQDRV